MPLHFAKLPTVSAMSTVSTRELFTVLLHRPYRRFVLAILLYNLPFFFVLPFYNVYYLEVLQLNFTTISIIQIMYFVVKIPALRFWGRIADRIGGTTVVVAVGPIYVFLFVAMALAEPHRVWPIYAAWTVAAFADAGFAVASNSLLYGSVPQVRSRQAYFATWNLLSLGLYGVGGAMAVPLLHAMSDVRFNIGFVSIGQFQAFFLLAAILMAITMFIPLLLKDRAPTGRLPIHPAPALKGSGSSDSN